MTPTVRSALSSDLDAMRAAKHAAGLAAWAHILPPHVLDGLGFPDRWTEAVASDDPRTGVLVAELDGEVVGFAVIRPSGDDDAALSTGELDGFYTAPSSWGKGAGMALLAAATRALRAAGFAEATLWTADDNHRPRRIYEAAGWRTDGTVRKRTFNGHLLVEVRYRRAL